MVLAFVSILLVQVLLFFDTHLHLPYVRTLSSDVCVAPRPRILTCVSRR